MANTPKVVRKAGKEARTIGKANAKKALSTSSLSELLPAVKRGERKKASKAATKGMVADKKGYVGKQYNTAWDKAKTKNVRGKK